MEVNRVYAAYFSPTGTTRAVVTYLAKRIAWNSGVAFVPWDFTLPAGRFETPSVKSTDVLVLGLPVYAGRLPNLMLKYLSTFAGRGALGVPVVLFGNRSYGNALIELRDLLEKTGFHTVAAAAFVGQHSFSAQLAPGRPDAADWETADRLAETISERIGRLPQDGPFFPVEVPGTGAPDYGGYYRPLGEDGLPVDFLKAKPVTTSACIGCKRCAGVCPLGSIDPVQVSRITGVCIKCNACIQICPVHAKQLADPAYLSHLRYLESTCVSRAAVEAF